MIRLAEERDLDELVGMIADEHAEMAGAPLQQLALDRALTRDNLAATLGSDDEGVLVSEGDGELRGLLWFAVGAFVPWSSDIVAVDTVVYVRPAYRGSYTGPALVKRYAEIARRVGAKSAYIGTASGIEEEAVCKFYERVGFRPSGRQMMRRLA